MERMLLISAIDSNETGKRADRTGNSPITQIQTRHAYDMREIAGKDPALLLRRKPKRGGVLRGGRAALP